MTLKIGIVGATGNVGREMLSILAEKGFKSENIFPIASSRSEGMKEGHVYFLISEFKRLWKVIK